MITLRIFHPGRLVFRVGRLRAQERGERWLVVHRRPVDWEQVLGGCLQLMLISPAVIADGLQLDAGSGTILWRQHTTFSVLCIDIRGFSQAKHRLILAALKKAARFQ